MEVSPHESCPHWTAAHVATAGSVQISPPFLSCRERVLGSKQNNLISASIFLPQSRGLDLIEVHASRLKQIIVHECKKVNWEAVHHCKRTKKKKTGSTGVGPLDVSLKGTKGPTFVNEIFLNKILLQSWSCK